MTQSGSVQVLLTKSFSEAWLSQLRRISPRLQVLQITADEAGEISDEVWAQVEVLYTWAALPDPARAPRLRWVQLDTAGVNQALNTPIWRTDIPLTTLNGIAPPNMSEFALMMMMAFGHHLRSIFNVQATRDWPSVDYRWTHYTPHELRGATLGIVGYGNIGRELGRLAHAHGMRVIAVDKSKPGVENSLTYKIPELVGLPGTEPDQFYFPEHITEALPQCDYVVLVVPYTSATHHLIDEKALRSMKASAVLVNIARGGVVDEKTLIRALQENWIAGAALDVFEDEPLPIDSPLWQMANVILSPHVAGFTSRYDERVMDLFSQNLKRYLAGEPLLNQVRRDREY